MPQMHKYPTSFQATDCVIIDRKRRALLLGRKKVQPKFRFLGGFVDPADESLEMANVRERREEAGPNLECSMPQYLFSFRVDDPRYKDSVDKIMSAVFLSKYIFGMAEPTDDLAGGEIQWFKIKDLKLRYPELIMPEHYAIMRGLVERKII